MVEVVGVRFREAGHIYYFAPGKSEYIYNEKVLVESQQSKQLIWVAALKYSNTLRHAESSFALPL